MVWKSQVVYFNPLLAEKKIIHGHRPITIEQCKKQINENKQEINIDTGCVYKEKVGYGKMTAIEPLFKSIPQIVHEDKLFYELLAITDTIRVGKAREINIAKEELEERLKHA
jgi:hypothetical protein